MRDPGATRTLARPVAAAPARGGPVEDGARPERAAKSRGTVATDDDRRRRSCKVRDAAWGRRGSSGRSVGVDKFDDVVAVDAPQAGRGDPGFRVPEPLPDDDER